MSYRRNHEFMNSMPRFEFFYLINLKMRLIWYIEQCVFKYDVYWSSNLLSFEFIAWRSLDQRILNRILRFSWIFTSNSTRIQNYNISISEPGILQDLTSPEHQISEFYMKDFLMFEYIANRMSDCLKFGEFNFLKYK